MTDLNSSTPAPGQNPSLGRSILIVDDESMIRRVAELSLTGAGYRVSEAGNATTAVETIRAAGEPFDLVLLDLTMPDGDGTTVIPVIRQHAPQTRILVVSGLGQTDPSRIGAN